MALNKMIDRQMLTKHRKVNLNNISGWFFKKIYTFCLLQQFQVYRKIVEGSTECFNITHLQNPLLLSSNNCVRHPWTSQVVLVVKNTPANAGDGQDAGLIPVSGKSSGGGRGNPFQYSCLENPMHRGAWRTTVRRVTELDTTKVT